MKTRVMSLFVACLFVLAANQSWAYTIKVVFDNNFSTSFQGGGEWDALNEQDVKDAIVSKMTDHYSARGISVSTSSGDVEVRIGVSTTSSALGDSNPGGGIGSFQDANPHVEVYSHNFEELAGRSVLPLY